MEKQLEKLKTSRFGEIEIDPTLSFDFISPIIGFSEHKKFALVDYRPDSPFKWLQSTEDGDLAFPVTLCSYFNIPYEFEITDDDAEKLKLTSAEDILALNIVTIPKANPKAATVNLLAPIIVNIQTNKAMQVILKDNEKFKVRYRLFDEDANETTADKGVEGEN